ncbi:MAG: LysE family translocator [Cyanobacteria bacterium P01_F01_bin.86]
MSIEVWLAFVLASTLLLIIPGPTILTVISYALAHGRRANVPLVTAVMLGDSTALVMSLLGLGALLATSAFWFTVIKWVGGLYILYLGIKLLRAGIAPTQLAMQVPAASRRQLFINTYLVSALNPKGIMFYVAFLPQFTNPSHSITPQLWILAVTFLILATLNILLYTMFAASARQLFATRRAQRSLNIAGGSLLSVAGIYALMARRST